MNTQVIIKLEQAIDDLNIDLSSKQIEALLNYLAIMQKWNKVYNLTAIIDLEEMLIKHVIDSLAIISYLKGDRFIDVGTGGGLPGVVLAIVFPEAQIDMLDSNHKKTRFLVQVKAELKLKRSKIIHSRVENYHPNIVYDGVISRAFANLEDMVVWTKHLLKTEGFWWAMKGKFDVKCLDKSQSNHLKAYRLQVPFLNAERTLVELRNING